MSLYLKKKSDVYYDLSISQMGMTKKFYVGERDTFENLDKEVLGKKFFDSYRNNDLYLGFETILRIPYKAKLQRIVEKNIHTHLSQKIFDTENFIHDFVFNSNQSEGSKIAKEEFLRIVSGKKSTRHNKNEVLEVENSMKLWKFLHNGFIRNESGIKKCYSILTKNLLGEKGEPYPKQAYKKVEIMVGDSPTLEAEQVPNAMKSLIQRYHSNKKTMFPLQFAAEFYYQFERIHPFKDGNGRVGRMLMNKILTQTDMIPLTIFAENRTTHFNAFKKSSPTYMTPMYQFMIDQYEKTLQ